MKDYLVTHKFNKSWIYIVSAKDAKDAINQVYEAQSGMAYKEDFLARSLGSLHNEQGKIINIKC